MKVVFLGASRGIGRALARLMAERRDRIYLLGRDPRDLAKCAHDLDVRSEDEAVAGYGRADLAEPESFALAFDEAEAALDGLDAVVLTAAAFAPQEELELDPEAARRLLEVNFTGAVLFCEEARRRLLARGGGKLLAFSSVAGERGRKPVVLYGATKAGLTAYLEGLDHKFRCRGLVVTTAKPGFVKTGMTAALDPPPFAGEPEPVARRILEAFDRGAPVVYAPAPWRWVMAVIRQLPRAVMRRVDF